MGSNEIIYSLSIFTPCALTLPKRPLLLQMADINVGPDVQNDDDTKCVKPDKPR